MNKNNVIAVLVVLCVVGSIWGSLNSRENETLEKKLSVMTGELEGLSQKYLSLTENFESKDKNVREMRDRLKDVSTGSDQLKAHLSTSTEEMFRLQSSLEEGSKREAELQNTLVLSQQELQVALKDLKLAQKEIASIEASTQDKTGNLRSTIESRNKELSKVNHELAGVKATVEALQSELASKTVDLGKFKEQKNIIAARETSLQESQKGLSVKLEQAQTKIVEQEEALDGKNRKLDQYAKELSQLQVNMDVLLSEISKQKGLLEKIAREKEDFEKNIAGKDKQIEDLRSKLVDQNIAPAQ
jgi:chromosome segregation protein